MARFVLGDDFKIDSPSSRASSWCRIVQGGPQSIEPLKVVLDATDSKEERRQLVDMDTTKGHLWTALHRACSDGALKVVSWLIEEENANVNALTAEKETPLIMAANYFHMSIVEYLAGREGVSPG